MDHYSYQNKLKAIWEAAVSAYQSGNREPDSFFDTDTVAYLKKLGLNVMDVYDYAEDYVSSEEPDFGTFLMICEARRDYFYTVQKSQLSSKRLDPATLPAKDEEVKGIVWLPRIIPKALAKLKGELPPEIMYGCGGDRRFFKTNKIHPAEFLRAAWAYETTPDRLVEWVENRLAENR